MAEKRTKTTPCLKVRPDCGALFVAAGPRMDKCVRCCGPTEARRAALQVRFEWDGNLVLAYGITESAPFVAASSAEWAAWLNNEGPRKLREFLATRRA
jgi:hypothetical protein